jgi:hypothetical protein
MLTRLLTAYLGAAETVADQVPAVRVRNHRPADRERIQMLRSTRMDGYNMTISELDLIARLVRKAQQYFISTYSETTVRKP